MKILKSYLTLGAVGTFIISLFVAFSSPPQEDWKVPDEYVNLENKYPGGDEDDIGRDLYMKHCKSCHGKEGYGDGSKAGELETEMRDLTWEEVQAQTDGEMYYKSIIGRDEMPNYEKKIPDEEDRWLLINFIRTLE